MFLLVLALSAGGIVATLYAHAAYARRHDGIPTIPLYTNILSILRGETRNDFYEVRTAPPYSVISKLPSVEMHISNAASFERNFRI